MYPTPAAKHRGLFFAQRINGATLQYLLELTHRSHSRVVPIAVTEPSEARARGRAAFEDAGYVGELAVYVGDPATLGRQYLALSECDTRVAH